MASPESEPTPGTTNISRRDFLRLASGAAGAGFLSACSSGPENNAFSSPDAPFRIELEDAPHQLPTVARNPETFMPAPLKGLEALDPTDVELVAVRLPPIVAQTLNVGIDESAHAMGLVNIGGQNALIPVMGYAPDAFPQLIDLSTASPGEIRITPARFLGGLFDSGIGVSVNSRDLNNGFSFIDAYGRRHVVGGSRATGEYVLTVVEPRAGNRAERTFVARVADVNGDVLAYKTISPGVLSGDLRGSSYHYSLRHGVDGLAPSGSVIEQFNANLLGETTRYSASLTNGIAGGDFTPLMRVDSAGGVQYLVVHAASQGLDFGPVFVIRGRNGFLHAFRPGLSASVIDGITTVDPYYASFLLMLDRMNTNGGQFTVFPSRARPRQMNLSHLAHQTPEGLLNIIGNEVVGVKLPPPRAGIRRWPGWPGLAKNIGGGMLSVATSFPFFTVLKLYQSGNCVGGGCIEDAFKIELTQQAGFGGEATVGYARIDERVLQSWTKRTLDAVREGNSPPVFLVVNKGGEVSERSDHRGGVWFTVNVAPESVDKINVINRTEGAKTLLYYPGSEQEEDTLCYAQELAVPTTVVEELPVKDEFVKAIAGLVKKEEQPDFAYRRILTPLSEGVTVYYYVASFTTKDGEHVTWVVKDARLVA